MVRTSTDDEYEKIFDDKLDDQLMAQNEIDSEWVHLMTAGPLAVNYIGNLLVLASKRDFPLVRPPQFTFQHIQDPNSFRATLAQVTGSMYSALLAAHTAMDRIQINVQQVPGHVKTALKLVLAGSPMLIEIMLPKTLESISRITNESAHQARTTFHKFTRLQELILEVITVNNHTQSTQSNVVGKIQAQLDQAKTEQQEFDQEVDSIKNKYEDVRQQVEKARKEYEAAFNAIPTHRGWGRIKKAFKAAVSFVTNTVIHPVVTHIKCNWFRQCRTAEAARHAAALAEQQAALLAAQQAAQQAAEQAALLAAQQAAALAAQQAAELAAFEAAVLAAETAKQEAIAKANYLLGVLKETESRQSAIANQQAVAQQKLTEIINKMAALDLDRMSEQEIVDVLVESIMKLNEIKEQWGRLIQFFSKLSFQADSTQKVCESRFSPT